MSSTPPSPELSLTHSKAGPSISKRSAFLALLLLVPAPSLAVWLAMVVMPGPAGQAAFFLLAIWGVLLPAIWHRFVDKRRWSLSPPRRSGFGVAVASGLAMSAVVVLGYLWLGARWIDPAVIQDAAQRNGIATPMAYLLGVAYWVCINSLKEEYVYRWFMVERCQALVPPWLAIVLAGVFFTIHHVIAMAVQGFAWPVVMLANVGVFAGGVFWSWMYVRYQSVWPGYVSHAIVDIAVFAVGWRLIFMG